MSTLIDLYHRGRTKVIASYLLEGSEPAIVDCGPAACIDALERGLVALGLELTDLRHLLLTHIHPDHAGAAGSLARRNPRLQIHVSSIGAPHLIDPSRLERSTRRLFGEEFDQIFGELAPVPEENVHVVGDRVLNLDVFSTPGHASHHVSYLAPDGSCYSGDATGVRVDSSPFVEPVAPPPDLDLELWNQTLDEINSRRPARLCLPHFGIVENAHEHVELMRDRLMAWSERVRAGMSEEAFIEAAEAELKVGADPSIVDCYRLAAAFGLSYAGLKRYWDKRQGAG